MHACMREVGTGEAPCPPCTACAPTCRTDGPVACRSALVVVQAQAPLTHEHVHGRLAVERVAASEAQDAGVAADPAVGRVCVLHVRMQVPCWGITPPGSCANAPHGGPAQLLTVTACGP